MNVCIGDVLVDDKFKLLVTPEYPEYAPIMHSNCWIDVNIAAPEYEDDENENKRALIDVVAVMDHSRSMGGSKFDPLKNALCFIIIQLTTKDRLCLIVYFWVIGVVFHLAYVISMNARIMEANINTIARGRSTNLAGGFLKGLQVVLSRVSGADSASVLLPLTGTRMLASSALRLFFALWRTTSLTRRGWRWGYVRNNILLLQRPHIWIWEFT